MEWPFFQSQSHRPAQICREVFVAPSPHPEIQLWGQCHFFYEHHWESNQRHIPYYKFKAPHDHGSGRLLKSTQVLRPVTRTFCTFP